MQDVLNHPNKSWDWSKLSRNRIIVTDEIACYVRKRYAAFVISSAAFEAWTNPNFELCSRRLQREFDTLNTPL